MRILFCFAFFLTGGAFAQTPPPDGGPFADAVAKATPEGFVGSSVCKICHPAVWQNFFRNPHNKSLVAGDQPPAKTGCEGCHGPAKKHVEARGGKTTIPHAFSLMTAAQALDRCLSCHNKDFNRADIRHSSHTEAEVACNRCHSIHKSPVAKSLLAAGQTNLCYQCHPAVRAQFSMPSRHRVNEGFMNCTDCHNPHGAPAPTWRMGLRPRMVTQALANEEPCLKCHSDKRGPFAFEHPAVRVDGCETCHYPHGSPNPKLFRRATTFAICLECHNGAGSFGRQADGITVQSPAHDLRNPRYQNCTTCHFRIHGSNSDRLFLR